MQSTPQKYTALSQKGAYNFNLGIIRRNRCECQEYLCLQIPPIMQSDDHKMFHEVQALSTANGSQLIEPVKGHRKERGCHEYL